MKVELDLRYLESIAHSPLHNYVVPGVTSWLIGERSLKGCVRLFACERTQIEPVTPHSHRFDFVAVVLAGEVRQRLWGRHPVDGEPYRTSVLRFGGQPGKYEKVPALDWESWTFRETSFFAGESYAMQSHEIHSIYFSKGARVLVFEGPTEKSCTEILEPVVDGVPIDTFRVEPWMFRRPEEAKS